MDSGDGTGAGASARREYERRRARDQEATRRAWGRFGGIAVALSTERRSTTAWRTGAVGEERLGAALDGIASPRLRVLHDRRIPGTRANIDHIAVTGAGVWVIDAKRYTGRVSLRVEGGLLRPRTETLRIGGRDRTKLVTGVQRQVALVQAALPDVRVTGSLCFVDADWPLLGGDFVIGGVRVRRPRTLTKALAGDDGGTLDVDAVTAALADRFRGA
ncbi:nuclease-related domain-containing protein [Clavibacter sp. Sh2141]|uniref:nuclease-related domain-containing protein n=1 Tax=Clavibacter sp. Sh2141 TaxID=3395374 RepID=UPI0039BC7E13